MKNRIKELLSQQKRKTTMWARGGKLVKFNDLEEWKKYDELHKMLKKLNGRINKKYV